MPFGPYKDFTDCVKDVMKKKGFSKDRASAYCATIHKKITGKWPTEQSYKNKLNSLYKELIRR